MLPLRAEVDDHSPLPVEDKVTTAAMAVVESPLEHSDQVLPATHHEVGAVLHPLGLQVDRPLRAVDLLWVPRT